MQETKILGTVNDYLFTYFQYDDHGRVEQTSGNNHLDLTNAFAEVMDYTYDFADNVSSDAWKREGLRRDENKGLYIFKWLGNLFSVREDDGDFYVDQGPHFNYGKHGKS